MNVFNDYLISRRVGRTQPTLKTYENTYDMQMRIDVYAHRLLQSAMHYAM